MLVNNHQKLNTSSKRNNRPLLVGLTGGIGSGKSTVAKIFKSIGIPVFNSDDEAKKIVDELDEVKQQIKLQFGDVYQDGKLNRTKLAEIVFEDKDALEKLNSIVHPAVGSSFKKWVDENSTQPILIKEAAILIESGAYQEMDSIILVHASEQIRVERVMKRNGISEREVRDRMKNQMSEEEKRKHCDYVIDNESQLLIPQVLEIIKKLKSPA